MEIKSWKSGELAYFKCLYCGSRWSSKPGPTVCPECNHIFVSWENHELTLLRDSNLEEDDNV